MSFMNNVDMVEEDAADLQFPKDSRHMKIILVKEDSNTLRRTMIVDNQKLNRLLTLTDSSSSGKCNSEDNAASQCVICKSILHEPYIKCAECSNEVCLACFAHGREIGKHKNNHPYVIVRDDIPVFLGKNESNWIAREERILLKTLHDKGYGNWEAVSQALNWRYSPDECRSHYHDNYFGGIFERLLGLTHSSQAYFPENMPFIVKMRSIDPPRQDDITSTQFKITGGYRCARGDFDTPFDMSAEGLLTMLLNHDEESNDSTELYDDNYLEIEEQLKCSIVNAYNHRLRERQRRYKIMRDNGLIMTNKTICWISKYVDAFQSDANLNRFLSFMQICNPIKFDMLVESLKYYKDLQKTIFKLHELRQNGVRTLKGGSQYFKFKKLRQQEERNRFKSEKYSLFYDWRKFIPNELGAFGNQFLHSHAAIPNPRKKAGPLNIIGLPGYNKLTKTEIDLCSVVRILPQDYLNYKNILITENGKVGHVRLIDARRLIKIDVNKTRQIYDSLIENGHINKPN